MKDWDANKSSVTSKKAKQSNGTSKQACEESTSCRMQKAWKPLACISGTGVRRKRIEQPHKSAGNLGPRKSRRT
eukprot:1236664-Pleurochrysis_carterae.AAC.2